MHRLFHVPVRLLFVALVLPFASCGDLMPGKVEGTVQMAVVDYDSFARRHALSVRDIHTLEKLRTLEGRAVRILGGAELNDGSELFSGDAIDPDELEDLMYRRRPHAVDFSAFESQGVLYPEDFHSLNMATIYYHFERAHLFFDQMGAALPQLPVLYLPKLRNPDWSLLTDNAYWDPFLRAFGVLDFDEFDGLPLGMNAGVVTHEYAHAVFDALVFPGDDVPWLYENWLRSPAHPGLNRSMNVARSFNEGFADFFGAALTKDPNFLEVSLPTAANSRTLKPAEPRCLRDQAVNLSVPHQMYSPYELGSVIASALWESTGGTPVLVETTAEGLVQSMKALAELYVQQTDELSLPLHVEAIGLTMDSAVRASVCGHLLDRLGLSDFDVPACVDSRRPEVRCGS